jgi:hypothetical protein
MRISRWLTTAALTLALAPAASAETYTVTGTGDATGPCDGTTCASIRQALASAEANPGPDTILVGAGDHQLVNGALIVDSDVTLRGAGARTTLITATTPARTVEISAATATLTGLTLRNGTATAADGFHGGVLRAQSSSVTLDGVRVTGGRAYSGGGIANRNGVMLITNSLIDHNAAPDGGGDGGGILNFGGDGGASAHLTIRNSTIAFNSARLAGGLISYDNPQDEVTVDRVTVAYNSGGDRGTGGLALTTGTISVGGTIVAANPGGNCSAPVPSAGFNVEDTNTCGFASHDVDPGLEDTLTDRGAGTDVLALRAGSPAIDLGAETCTGPDQRGVARPQGARCDAGAYEVNVAPDTAIAGAAPPFAFSSDDPGSTFECSLDGAPFAACATPYDPAAAPGAHTLAVRAVDPQGLMDDTPAAVTFTVAAPPTPTPTSTPTPVVNKTVVVKELKGTIKVKPPGSAKFVDLDATRGIPVGSTVDAKHGTVELTSVPRAGAPPETAKFFDGIFKISQRGGITTLTLVEPLAPCAKKARAAAKKPKSRKLWGDGKGSFRTQGKYSAATIRGTKWLVTDSCAGTTTKVTQGVVSVRDDVLHRTKIVPAGKSYRAKPKR